MKRLSEINTATKKEKTDDLLDRYNQIQRFISADGQISPDYETQIDSILEELSNLHPKGAES